jgi:Zn-finger nucleic acid-binding protein
MSERQGVEIDYCPKCRGVWLDRGELDKIIEKSAGETPSAQPRIAHSAPVSQGEHYHEDKHRDHDGYGNQPYKKRKESLLGEIFDF